MRICLRTGPFSLPFFNVSVEAIISLSLEQE
nr:MAG TPA: hypothetical protein [Caudoviricetes sp.]